MGSNSENSRQVISLTLIQLKHTQTKMLRFAVLFVAATCSAIPIEDTPEVAEAKAAHLALVEEAKAGQIATAYLADDEAVAAAKAEFLAAFADAEAGGLSAKQAPAPVHEVPEVVAPAVQAVAAPIAVAGYPYAAYPYAAYPCAHHGFAYNTIAHHSYPYYAGLPYYGYAAGLPYAGYPFVTVKAAEEAAEEA